MTLAQHGPGVALGDVEEAVRLLRDQGLRVSLARRLMLTALFAADGPLSAEKLSAALQAAGGQVDVASVYRNLEAFERAGIVRHFHLGHGPGLYALARPDDREYLYCESCGEVRAVDAAELAPVREAIRAASGYEPRFSHFPIVGLCARCSSARALA